MATETDAGGTLHESNEKDIPLLARGKARDIYELPDGNLLIVTSDRISAFDVVLPTPSRERGSCSTRSPTSGLRGRAT